MVTFFSNGSKGRRYVVKDALKSIKILLIKKKVGNKFARQSKLSEKKRIKRINKSTTSRQQLNGEKGGYYQLNHDWDDEVVISSCLLPLNRSSSGGVFSSVASATCSLAGFSLSRRSLRCCCC